jgi:hypothetical protein
MEIIFKARTSVEEGLFIDGKLINSRWTEFVSDSLYQSCLKDPSIEVEIFKEGSYQPVTASIVQETASSDEKQAFVGRATSAELKVYLIEKKGFSKKDLSDLNKSDLIELVLAD